MYVERMSIIVVEYIWRVWEGGEVGKVGVFVVERISSLSTGSCERFLCRENGSWSTRHLSTVLRQPQLYWLLIHA